MVVGGGGGGESGEMITRLRICTLFSPKWGLNSTEKLILVHRYTFLVTVHGVTATPQTCEHSRVCVLLIFAETT